MRPLSALRTLEIAAERIKEGPQTGPEVIAALKSLNGKVRRWLQLSLWEALGTDISGSGAALIGARQTANACLNGLSSDLRIERLGPVELAALVAQAKVEARDQQDREE